MSRVLIPYALHPLQYPQQGQNYVFNGCMKFLMECVGEKNSQYDYWFFTAVSGDSYVQVFNTNKEQWSICFSQAKFDYNMIQRVFNAIGYKFTYLDATDWQKDKDALKKQLMESIDRGIPVIGKGFYSVFHGLLLPTSEISCIVGYENNGECFYRLDDEKVELIPFTLDDGLPYSFVFIGEKEASPPVEEAYRNALKSAPDWMRTPPKESTFFGNDAFEEWAKALEGGTFYHMSREKYNAANAIASWRYYCIYVCVISTNIFSKQYTTDRAIHFNPDLAPLAPALAEEYQMLAKLEKRLQAAGGGFNITYETLQDKNKCKEIARILREFPVVNRRICDTIEQQFKACVNNQCSF